MEALRRGEEGKGGEGREGQEKRKERKLKKREFSLTQVTLKGCVRKKKKFPNKTQGNKGEKNTRVLLTDPARTNTKKNSSLTIETFLTERIRAVIRAFICSLVQSDPFPNKLLT